MDYIKRLILIISKSFTIHFVGLIALLVMTLFNVGNITFYKILSIYLILEVCFLNANEWS